MNKFFCEQCNSIWYTSMEKDNLTCDKCGGKLTKVDMNWDNEQLKKTMSGNNDLKIKND